MNKAFAHLFTPSLCLFSMSSHIGLMFGVWSMSLFFHHFFGAAIYALVYNMSCVAFHEAWLDSHGTWAFGRNKLIR